MGDAPIVDMQHSFKGSGVKSVDCSGANMKECTNLSFLLYRARDLQYVNLGDVNPMCDIAGTLCDTRYIDGYIGWGDVEDMLRTIRIKNSELCAAEKSNVF